jgi:hypothetical protein
MTAIITEKKTQVELSIDRVEGETALDIKIRAPSLAPIIEKITPSYYTKSAYAEIYQPILVPWADDTTRVITRSKLSSITSKLVQTTQFDLDKPAAVLLYNPKALRDGFKLTYRFTAPIALESIQKWGDQFMAACREIQTNAKPFRMRWVMPEAR